MKIGKKKINELTLTNLFPRLAGQHLECIERIVLHDLKKFNLSIIFNYSYKLLKRCLLRKNILNL